MATEDSGNSTKQIENVFKRLAQQQEEQARASRSLAKAMDDLGKTAITDLEKRIKKLAKDQGILDDAQLSLIKSTKDLADALEQQEKDIEANIKKEKDSLESLYKVLKTSESFYTARNKKLSEETKLEIKLKEEQIAAQEAALEKYKLSTKALVDHAIATNELTQHYDKAKASISGWVKDNLTLRTSVRLLKEGINKQISELNKATGVGLQTSFAAIGMEAIKLKMSFDEFSDIISKNRDAINQLGGNVAGVKEFGSLLKEASKNLEYMGKDGIVATGRFVNTLKTMGISTRDKVKFKESMSALQERFAVTSKLYGDNYEQYADLIESQMDGEGIQSRLNTLNQNAADSLRKEIILRTENLKAMGMSNEQIKQFNNKLENLYNPRKNDQAEKAKSSEFEKAALIQLAERSGSEELKANLPALIEAAEKKKWMNSTQIANMEASMKQQYLSVGKAQSMVDVEQERLGEAGRYHQANLQQVKEYGGERVQRMFDMAQSLVEAENKDKIRSSEDRKKAEQEAKNEIKGNVDNLTKSIKSARDIQQQYNAIMESSIGIMSLGFAAAVGTAAISAYRLAKALNAAAAAAGHLPKGTTPFGGGKMGKFFSKFGKLTIGSLIGGLLLDEVGDYLKNNGNDKAATGIDILGSTLTGAGLGSLGGPVGAVVGGVLGFGKGVYDAAEKYRQPQTQPQPQPQQQSLPQPTQPSYTAPTFTPQIAGSKKFNGFGAEMDGYISDAAKKYGMDEGTLRGFIKMEDGWTGKMSPTGAIGTGQFIQKTWNGLANSKEGKDIGMTTIDRSNFRTANDPRYNKQVNTMATALLAKQNADMLTKNGIPVTAQNLYMMHNIGPGVIPALKGDNNVSYATLMAMNANGKKSGQSPTEFVAMQQSKFNTQLALANGSSTSNTPISGVPNSTSTQIQSSPVTTTASPVVVAAESATLPTTNTSSKSQETLVAELQRQTDILKTIAMNTSQDYHKPSRIDRSMLKDNPALMANNYA